MFDEPATGRTVVCVHGAGGGGWEWTIWARVLAARGWNVIAPDLRPVAAGVAATRFADYRDQVATWCAGAGGGESVVLVGASLGGLLALDVANDVDAAALVLVNSLSPEGSVAPRRADGWPSVVPWRSRSALASTQRAMPDADDAARLYAFRRWRDESGAVLDEAGRPRRSERPRCRVLVVASDADPDVPFGTSRRLAERWDADVMRVTAASHVGPLLGRSAAVTAATVAGWLQASPAAGRSPGSVPV